MNPHMNWLRGRDLVQFDEKRREARTKGQIADDGNLLFCSVLHRLFTKEIITLSLSDHQKHELTVCQL